MKRIKKIFFFQVLFVILFFLLFSGCKSYFFNSKGTVALEESRILFTAFKLMLLIVIPVIFMSIVFFFRYRKKKKNENYDPEFTHSTVIEIIIWVVPIIIIGFLANLAWKSTHTLDPNKSIISKNSPIKVDVVALDWKWLFIYPKYKIATINELAIPVDTPIQFTITSNSVMNSFFIPSLGSQIYAMFGMKSALNLISSTPGEYKGFSANYSGGGFSDMKFKVLVKKNENYFLKWIKKVQNSTKKITNLVDFNKIAKPSIFNKVVYYSISSSNLFDLILNQSYGICHKK